MRGRSDECCVEMTLREGAIGRLRGTNGSLHCSTGRSECFYGRGGGEFGERDRGENAGGVTIGCDGGAVSLTRLAAPRLDPPALLSTPVSTSPVARSKRATPRRSRTSSDPSPQRRTTGSTGIS